MAAAFPVSDYILGIFFLGSSLTFVRGFEKPDAGSLNHTPCSPVPMVLNSSLLLCLT